MDDIKTEPKPNNLITLNYQEFVKSNALISAMFKTTKFEKKILAICYANMNRAYTDSNNLICLELKASELREILKANKGSFYSSLDTAAQSLTGKTLGYQDPEKKIFDYKVLIMESAYSDGILKVVFNPQFKNLLYNLSGSFTRLNLDYYLSFSSIYSFDLYEILKSYAYTRKGQKDNGVYMVTIPLSELKLLLGITDPNEENVKRFIKGKERPDYDKAVEAEKEPKFVDWTLFKKKVLVVGTKEINQLTNLEISFTPKRGGANGAPVYAVDFVIINKDIVRSRQKDKQVQERKERCLSELQREDFLRNLTELELGSLLEEAEYDMDRIKNAIGCAKGKQIDNLMGWMVTAIRKNYQTSSSKNSFLQFQQNEYDFDQLELELTTGYSNA